MLLKIRSLWFRSWVHSLGIFTWRASWANVTGLQPPCLPRTAKWKAGNAKNPLQKGQDRAVSFLAQCEIVAGRTPDSQTPSQLHSVFFWYQSMVHKWNERQSRGWICKWPVHNSNYLFNFLRFLSQGCPRTSPISNEGKKLYWKLMSYSDTLGKN